MKDRLKEVIDYHNISVRQFSLKIGVNESTIRKILKENTSIQSDNLAKIAANFPIINLDWLITGRGSMLFSPKTEPEKQPADTELLPLMGGYKPKKEPEKQPAATSDLHLQAEIDKLKAICAEKDARISDLQERIDSQRHFLDILSESHRDLVDKTESIASVATDERH